MHTGQYGAPRPAAREELKVSTLHRGWHRRVKLRLRDGETFHFVMISAIVNPLNADLLTLRLLMSHIYMEHLFLMFLDHTQRRTTVGRLLWTSDQLVAETST